MSSLNISAILSAISVMEKELAALKAQVAPVTEKKEAKKEKKEAAPSAEEKKPRAPTAWLVFTERVRGLLREADYPSKALGPEMTKFCSELKKDNEDLSSWSSEDILARRAAWTAPEAKAPSAPASVVEEAAEEKKPEEKKPRKSAWEGLSEEDRAAKIAKMQAGRAAKKAAKSPEVEEAAPVAAPASDGEASVTSSEKKKRGPKKLADMSSEERLAHEAKVKERAAKKAEKKAAPSSPELPPLPPSPVASVGESSFKRVLLDGKRYLVNMTSGHTYFRAADDSQGDWAGIFKKTGSKKTGGPWVDDSVSEPVFTDLEELD